MNPQLTVFVTGLGVVNGDQLNTFVQTTDLITDLRSFTGLSNMVVRCQGGASVGDGLGGDFYFNATSASADNGFSVIVPSGSTSGAWLRLNQDVGPWLVTSTSYANDAAAAAGGVPVGGLYRNSSVIQMRIS